MYAYNGGALFALRGMGISRCTLPLELHGRDLSSLPEVTGLEREMLVYGRIPMMVSAQCLKKNTSGCDRISETVYLQDRMTERMPVKNRCLYCYNTIYNAKPLSTLSRRELVRRLRPDALRLWFTTESGPEVNRVLQSYLRAYLLNEETGEPVRDYTLGHLKRGI